MLPLHKVTMVASGVTVGFATEVILLTLRIAEFDSILQLPLVTITIYLVPSGLFVKSPTEVSRSLPAIETSTFGSEPDIFT